MGTRNVTTVTLGPSDVVVLYVGDERWVVRAGRPGGISVEAQALVAPPVQEDDATVTLGVLPTPIFHSMEMRLSPRRRNASPQLLIEIVEE
jgi:hypothetical protein